MSDIFGPKYKVVNETSGEIVERYDSRTMAVKVAKALHNADPNTHYAIYRIEKRFSTKDMVLAMEGVS